MVNATLPASAGRRNAAERSFWPSQATSMSSETRRRESSSSRSSRTWTFDRISSTSSGTEERQGYTSVAQIINHETQSRVLIDRLRELVAELRALRTRAETLGARSQIGEVPINFNSSLQALDNSVTHLFAAIEDLERRIMASSRNSSEAANFERQLVNPFTPSPLRSLLARTRHGQNRTDPSMIAANAQSQTTSPPSEILEQRLAQISRNLSNLNARLDQVARGFREMHNLEDATRSPQRAHEPWAVSLSTGHTETVAHSPTLAANGFIESISGRLARGQEVSPEELELQARLRHIRTSGFSRPEWDSESHRRGLLEISRRAVQRNVRTEHQTQDLSPRLIGHTASSGTQTQTQSSNDHHWPHVGIPSSWEHLVGNASNADSARDAACQTVKDSTRETKITKVCTKEDYIDQAPKVHFRSSHEVLFTEPQKLFWQGTEYRNCLGLWLSVRGQAPPIEALRALQTGHDQGVQ